MVNENEANQKIKLAMYIKTFRDEQMLLAIFVLSAYVLLAVCGIRILIKLPVLKILCPVLILGAIGGVVFMSMDIFNVGPFKEEELTPTT